MCASRAPVPEGYPRDMGIQETAISSPVVAAFGGRVFGLDPSTGRVLWEHEVGSHTPRIIVTDTRVFVAGNQLLCLTYPDGAVVWKQEQYTSLGATFILSEGRLLSGSGGEVVCYSAIHGELLWTNKFPGKGSAEVALGTPFNAMQMDNNT